MKKSITDYLDEVSLIYKNKNIFVENKDNKITYQKFVKEAKVVASNILIDKYYNQPIAIFISKSINCLKAMFGVLYSGNFYCVLDTDSPKERIEKIIETLNPVLILTDSNNIEKLGNYNFNIKTLNISSQDLNINNKALKEVNRRRIDTNPAYVLFTSGSTGIPKGSVITHKSLIAYTTWFKETFDINEKTIFGNQTPFYFSMSVSDVFSTVISGATLNIIPKINFSFPVNLIKYMNDYKINTIYWVPSALSIVANLNTFDYVIPKYLEKVLFAGEVMPMPQLNIWRKHIDAMYANLYGPTETTDICTYYVVNRKFKDNETLPIGNNCNNLEILLVNENGESAKENEIGEIFVRGSFVGSGYYNNKEKTELAFVQNPLNKCYPEIVYKTGDLGRYNKYGEIEYFGRKDFQIKHMGYRIELGEIETNINSLKGLTICATIYDNLNKKIVLFYESNSLTDDDVIKYINQKLLKYMQPNKVIKLSKMPYNANGKIDRVKLKEIYEKGNF